MCCAEQDRTDLKIRMTQPKTPGAVEKSEFAATYRVLPVTILFTVENTKSATTYTVFFLALSDCEKIRKLKKAPETSTLG